MKGSGDDDNHRLGEMLLFLVLLSLVLFCCLARPTVETKQYIEMLCIECETKKNTRWNCYAFLVCWIFKCNQSIHIYDDTVYHIRIRSIVALKNRNYLNFIFVNISVISKSPSQFDYLIWYIMISLDCNCGLPNFSTHHI